MSTAVARTAGFAAAGLGGTAIVVGAPHVRFLYQLPTAEAAVDTAVTLAGTFVAVVCVRRFQREQRWGDLLVAAAMLLVAMAEPLFGGVASLLAPYEGARLAPRLVRLLAAVALAVASARPPGDPANGRRRLGPGVPATMAVTVAAVICVLMWRGTALSLAPGTSEAPRILGDPAVSAVSLAAAGMFVIATLGFTARGRPADRSVSRLARLRLCPECRGQSGLRAVPRHLAQLAPRGGLPPTGGRRGVDGWSRPGDQVSLGCPGGAGSSR